MSTKKLLKGILLLFWCLFIFLMSHAEGGTSQKISYGLLSLLLANAPSYVEFVVRKMAHFSEYAILGVLSYLFFGEFRISAHKNAFIFSFLYAVSDEVHQLFVKGRSGQWSDVLIDSLGALCGILFCLYLRRRKESGVTKRKGNSVGD